MERSLIRRAAITTAIVGALLVGLYLGASVYLFRGNGDLLVCRGELEELCEHHTEFVDCTGSVAELAKRICRRSYNLLPASENEHTGGRCGYNIVRVFCQR